MRKNISFYYFFVISIFFTSVSLHSSIEIEQPQNAKNQYALWVKKQFGALKGRFIK